MTAFHLAPRGIFVENSTQREMRKKRRALWYAGAAGIILALSVRYAAPILIVGADVLWRIEDSVASLGAPIFAGIADKEKLIMQKEQLTNELAIARDEIVALESRVADFEEIDARFLLGADRMTIGTSVVVRALVVPPTSPFDTIVVDGGSNRGIAIGDMAYADSMTALGVVREVFPQTAIISLFTSPGEKNDVTIPGVIGTLEAEGYGGGTIAISVPHGVEVATDTPVYLFGSHYVIGIVGDEHPKLRGNADRILASNPLSLRSLSWIRIQLHE